MHDDEAASAPPPPVDLDRPDLQLASTVFSKGARSRRGASGTRPEPRGQEVAENVLGFTDRYELAGLIGRGGMGEVSSCRDRVVGREVALKRMRSDGRDSSSKRSWRFVREARIQGQLEHPAVLPVYDLGLAPDGEPFFTMKRVRGQSLAEVLAARRASGSGAAEAPMSLRRLLTLFSNVCLAVDFIHSRGVIHRDLKPANIMLGSYGEAYLLDWGLAKLAGSGDDPIAETSAGVVAMPATLDGEVLGTPGYMAPEQLRGEAARADHRADVYSLGAILFELLASERMHHGESMADVLLSTLKTDGARASERCPGTDVPPELDELCARATRLDASERLGTAKELSDGIEAFLDGARDAQRRRELAREHVDRARAALAASIADGADEAAERASAMREVTTALGLDPRDPDAIQTLVTLLTRPPATVPPEAERQFLDAKDRMLRSSTRSLIAVYLGYAFYVPFPFLMGVRSWWAFGILAAGTLSCIVAALYHLTRERPLSDVRVHLLAASVTAGLATVVFGPLVLVPMLAMATGIAYAAGYPKRWVFGTVVSSLGFVVPLALHLAGVLPETLSVSGGAIVARSWLMSFPTVPTVIFLVLSHVAVIATACWYVARTQAQHEEMRRLLHIQAWHLQQILPQSSRDHVSV